MKKWFEFQEKFHKKRISDQKISNDINTENFVLFNIEKEKIRPILEISKTLLGKNEFKESLCFPSEKYIEFLKISYKKLIEINHTELKNWIEDPQYSMLMTESGKELILEVYEKIFNKILQCVKSYFNINWSKADVKLYVQLPGQMFPLHYDAYKSSHHTDSHDNEHRVKRWLIMLEDQKPGQCFLMGDTYMSWKQGDVIAWKNVELPHGSGNFGYWPRFTLRITGEILE